MNKTQRIHAIKSILKEDFAVIEIEFAGKVINGLDMYRLRNARRIDWAIKIEKALSNS